MSLYKRKESDYWQIQFTDPNGRRVQVSAGTADRKAAQELHDKLKHETWQQRHLQAKPVRLWEEAVTQWFAEQAGRKKSLDRDKWEFRWLHPHLCGVVLSDITRTEIARLAQVRLDEGLSNSSVNRMLALIRAVLNKAKKDWEWIDKVPVVAMLPESHQRIRFLTQEEGQRLLGELPSHLAEMVRFSLATGLREMNVVDLQWANVDLDRACCWVWADEAKGKRSFVVPFNDEALAVIRRQQGKHLTHVFTYEGKPVTRANNHAWRKALVRAGIHDFRWHDLRHTWASWHVQRGTPLHILKELGGWKTMEMVLRYAHLSPGHLAEWAGNASVQPQLRLVANR